MWMKGQYLEVALYMVIAVINLRTPASCAAWCGASLGINQDLLEQILLNLL